METPEEESVSDASENEAKHRNNSPGAVKLRSWINKNLRIKMTDGRVLVGVFLCTDRDANVILGSCTEYLPSNEDESEVLSEEPRMLGLVMIPGKHIVSVHLGKQESVAEASNLEPKNLFK